MNPLEALRLQLRLEGLDIMNGGLLRQVEIVPGEDMPLMVIAQLADRQVVVYYDRSLEPDFRRALQERSAGLQFPEIGPPAALIQGQNIPVEVGHYRTLLFPGHVPVQAHPDVLRLPGQHPWVERFGFGGFACPVHGIEREGKLVSACVSVRENRACGEGWVYTDPDYRNLGFARQVVGAWAHSLIAAGKVPFYSHRLGNIPSARLAASLGLEPAFEEISISRKNV